MTNDQQKELDVLLEALECNNARMRHNKVISSDQINIHLAAQSYAEHFAEIQALKSGEWVLVPSKPTQDMCFRGCEASNAPTVPAEIYKTMIAARPKLKENTNDKGN